MTSTRRGDSLPLLHKYVLQPQDDLQLVLTKLNYRLCVKEVSKVIYRRSLGDSISEAVDIIENSAEMNGHREVEPLVLSHEGPQCVSSPKTLSPEDSYCGTMKSDDSGIVMDESHMNFSGDQSDMMFSSAEVSPLEEDNHILNGVKTAYLDDVREDSVSPAAIVYEKEIEQEHQREDVEEYNTESPDITESTEESETITEIQVEEIKASTTESQEATPVTEDQSTLEETKEISADLEETSEQQPHEEELETEQKESTTANEQKEEQENQNETVQEEEEERVEFVKDLDAESGIRCDDVYTALQILKTKYKLSDTTVRRFIITFSSWDISQMSYPISNRSSWWDESQHVPTDTTEIEDLTEDIYTRQGEISELVDRIMEEEQVKHDMLQKLKKEKEEPEVEAPVENIEPAEAPKLETEPSKNEDDVIEEADKVNEDDVPSDKDSKHNKKKNRNAWQRFVHALRKRMRRNSSRPPTTDKERAKA